MLGGIAISGIQRVIGIEKPTPRPLWKDELEVLQQIFVNSIDYDAISILEGDLGLLGLADSVFTLGHRIYVSQGSGFVSLRQNKSVLVHEATHIWQFQNGGPDYVSEALIAQTWGDGGGRCLVGEPGAVPPPYPQPAPRGYGFEQDVKAGVTWENLNPEQQATFIETGFQVGFNFQDPAAGVMDPFGDYPAYADYMREALRLIRGGDGTPNNPL
jgi:hypothetical protein